MNKEENFLKEVSEKENLDEFELIDNQQEQFVKLENDLFRPWRQKEYQSYLKNYLKQKYGKTDIKLTNEFAAKVYKKMYNENISKNKSFKYFDKLLLHPKITVSDRLFLEAQNNKKGKYLLTSFFASFAIVISSYYGTRFGNYLRNNTLHATIFFLIMPLGSYLFTNIYYQYMIDLRIRKAGLYEKYSIS